MKVTGALVTTFAATTLFTGTVVGGLAMQGRLNFEGTQGIPLLHSFFEEPPAEEGEGHADPHADPHAAPAADPHAAPPGAHPPRVDGMGREEPLEHAVGPSVVAAGGAEPVGRPVHPEPDPHAEDQAEGHDPGHGSGAAQNSDWQHSAESLMGQGQYRRGKLFRFAQLDSGMSVEELDRVLISVNEMKEALHRRSAALDEREAAMNAREADIEERGKEVRDLMRRVLQARESLKEDIAAFERTYTLVQKGKVAEYRQYASTLAALEPERAVEIVQQMLTTEEGKARVTRILKMMAAEPRQEILGLLTAEQTRELLDRLSRAVVEGEGR